ncbi:MAG: acyl-CoA dehydrogenase family protein [Deltaproteobacteria bacterium]|nr:acyl-CoA dehydrogenase family protein [Deltaproteobacteria bacterium]
MRPEIDFYGIDELLNEEERLVRDSVRAFVDERVMPIIQKHYRAGTFPKELVPDIARLGLLGSTLKEYGGAGVGPTAYGLINQELERGDSGIRSFVSVQSGLVIYPIYAFGSPEQKERWLPRLIRGEAIGCFGLTEPDFGSNPTGMRTTARRDGSGFILNGTKRWITNGNLADVAVVWAKLDDQVMGFLVERGAPGFSTVEIEGKLSLRASVTSELIFEDCRIPGDAIFPGVQGMRGPLSCLTQARYGIAWGATGAAMACFEEALSYAKERVQFDRPIAGFQLTQAKLVEMYSDIVQAQLLCLRLGQLKAAGKASPVAVSLAKRNNVAMALRIARVAREILGASGIVDDYAAMRHMCNLESVYTYEGTHDIHTLIVGQALTGIPAFSGSGR